MQVEWCVISEMIAKQDLVAEEAARGAFGCEANSSYTTNWREGRSKFIILDYIYRSTTFQLINTVYYIKIGILRHSYG